ncbi:hypothetical protein AALP_AA5G109800 [Arabis alpina]|uniref:DEK-C domain-containing protein n=1 Tax=Arabis alpina TaxID=50452 RepID=A0A087GWC0_ARAAL|nr:hypothetical protein AALP_AA5G109800 [Arabis alpina]
MATETLEVKTQELDSTLKEENGITESEKKEAPVSDDKEEEDEEEKTGKEGKSPVTPVSERPTRERKKTVRYIMPTSPRSSGTKPVLIEQGRGTRLKEIPNVAYKLSKRKADDNLFLLHTILYGKKGKVQMVKRNIGQFSGFVWSEQEEVKQRAKAKEKLEKCIKEKLVDFCDLLDIPINKSIVKKEELTVKLLEFLVSPKATRDVVLADREKETKKRKKSTPKSAESSDVPAKRRRQTEKSGKKQDQPSETEEGNDEGDVGSKETNDSGGKDDAAPEKVNDKNEDTESDDEKDKAEEKKSNDKKRSSGRRKKEKPAPEEEKSLKGPAKSGRKSSKQVDKSTSSSSQKQKVDKDDTSKEKGKKQTSKPQAKGSKDQGKATKKGKKEPTRKELHVVVAKILKEVDFNTATLSDILRKLGSHFGVDLMHRKTEVKDIITDALNEMSDDDERDENTEDEV